MDILMLPHDISTAVTTLKRLRGQVGEHKEAAAQLIFALAFMILGAGITWFFAPSSSKLVDASSGALLAVAAGALAYAAILIGFVVNLMLFSGKIESAGDYSPEELELVVDRIRYLLYSQMVTLFAAIGLSAMTLLMSLLLAAGEWGLGARVVLAATGGFALLCIVRTAVLPLQIYELHEASFLSLLLQSRKAARDRHKRRSIEEE
ncbi:hypothetical protein [Stenotrophomonas bentonitica]